MGRVPLAAAVMVALALPAVGLRGGVEEAAEGLLPDALVDGSGGLGGPPLDVGRLEPAPGLRFGIDAESVDLFAQHGGGPPDYATVWVGRWNLEKGWMGTDAALADLRSRGVTPAVHLYYWGDDMAPACLSAGCNGKDVHAWQRLAEELVRHLHATLGGGPAVVVLESEFNKHGVHEDEALDGMLAEKAAFLKAGYPGAKVVLGLGNWHPQAWDTWDRAAAASDYVGLQALAGSTRDPEEEHLRLLDSTVEGALRLRSLFGKPVFVQDVAVSSYPEPGHLEVQAEALARFAEGMPRLQEAGVEAVVYRSFLDVPDMALGNHYAEAERHWGLAWGSGELKPGGEAWMAAVHKARAAVLEPGEPGHPGNGTAPG